ncbi:unnamed protein product [Ectocarpus sp. 4 AP-2014]
MACPPLSLVLCCVPCYGHAKPLVLLAEHLAEAGHEVTFVTSQPMVARIQGMCRDPRVAVLGLQDELVPESDHFLLGMQPHVKKHPVWYAEEKMTPSLVALIKGMPRPPDMMISDHLTWAGANAARIVGVKHACHVAWPLFMLEQCGFLPARSLSGVLGAAARALRSSRLAPAFLKPPGPPRAMLDRVRQQCLGVEEGSAGLVLVNSFGIEPPRALPPCLKVIGRGHLPETVEDLEEHPELKTFLDSNDAVVFVTFGSRVTPPPSLVRTVAEGLVTGGWAVVWSLKEADASHLPPAALASGRFFIRPWLPQGAALAHPHVKVAVTHCGMGGLYECAVNAVPIVPLPFSLSADQPVNAAIAEAAGFAVRPRPISRRATDFLKFWQRRGDPEYAPAAIHDAVLKILRDPSLAEGASRAKRAALAAGYGHVAVDAVESTCLYGTDNLPAENGGIRNAAGATQTLRGIVGGVVVGAVLSGLLAVKLSHGGSRRTR